MDAIPLRWLVLTHVLAAIAFFALHAPSMAAMLALRRERAEPAAVRALLELSRRWSSAMWAALGVLVLSGAWLATAERAWAKPWVWGSAVVLLLVSGSMSPMIARPMNEVRAALGLPYMAPKSDRPPADPALVAPALEVLRRRAWPVVAVGVAGAVALVWLMVTKPGA